uniref:Uncharacterized protein n=1 Tax=Lepeophtheirus salmonis TaxID=72036 RepID=A0A0K2TTU1_LEPSM
MLWVEHLPPFLLLRSFGEDVDMK